jgi:hypothetical protein
MDNWVSSCYPAPSDRIITTSSKICQYGIQYSDISNGEKEANKMWKDFMEPMLNAWDSLPNHDAALASQIRTDLYNLVMLEGQPHSYRLEWIFLRTRVRYFEIIPNWEIARVHDDAGTYFQEIEEFRSKLLSDFGIVADDLYSEETLNEMRQKKDDIRAFLKAWENHEDWVYDDDANRNRKKLKDLTRENSNKAKDIYNWHYNMVRKQMKWKSGKPHDMVSANYQWNDLTRFVRGELYRARDGFNFGVRGELEKFHFHFWRRI